MVQQRAKSNVPEIVAVATTLCVFSIAAWAYRTGTLQAFQTIVASLIALSAATWAYAGTTRATRYAVERTEIGERNRAISLLLEICHAYFNLSSAAIDAMNALDRVHPEYEITSADLLLFSLEQPISVSRIEEKAYLLPETIRPDLFFCIYAVKRVERIIHHYTQMIAVTDTSPLKGEHILFMKVKLQEVQDSATKVARASINVLRDRYNVPIVPAT